MGDTAEFLYRRKFLNRERFHSGAHVVASIKGNEWGGIQGTVNLADCRRSIELDFNADTRAEARNALHKARLLANTFGEVAALELAMKDYARDDE